MLRSPMGLRQSQLFLLVTVHYAKPVSHLQHHYIYHIVMKKASMMTYSLEFSFKLTCHEVVLVCSDAGSREPAGASACRSG